MNRRGFLQALIGIAVAPFCSTAVKAHTVGTFGARPRMRMPSEMQRVAELQRLYNYYRSQEMELLALPPRCPWVV